MADTDLTLIQHLLERTLVELGAMRVGQQRLDNDMGNLVTGHAAMLTSLQLIGAELRAELRLINVKLDQLADIEARIAKLEIAR